MRHDSQRWSRRGFLTSGTGPLIAGAAMGATGLGATNALAAAADAAQHKIRDVQTMTLTGPRTYVYVRILTDDGHWGIGEGYGSPGVGVAEQIMSLKPYLVGKNPLEIDKLYTYMGTGTKSLSGTRTDGSAHNLMRAVSAVEMALWDLAGHILNTPTSILMGGQFRDHTRVYDHSRPTNMLDKASCSEWAAKAKAHPSGFTAHKIELPRTSSIWQPSGGRFAAERPVDNGHDEANRQLTTEELVRIAQGFENCREAIGWDHDIMVHCHWELDLRSSIELAQAVAPMKPLWLEDPLQVDYTDSWKRLVDASPVPILMGENLTRLQGFLPWIVNQAIDIVNPDLRNSGGFLETKRVADLASVYGIPMTNHGTASQLYTYQVCQWASCIRDYMICETITGEGGWEDQLLVLDGPYIQKGYIKVNNKPGSGAELNQQVVEAHLAPGEKWWGSA